MIEIFLTCVLLAGQAWHPPAGWVVEQITPGGTPNIILVPGPLSWPTTVVLRRSAKPGESFEIPNWCISPTIGPK